MMVLVPHVINNVVRLQIVNVRLWPRLLVWSHAEMSVMAQAASSAAFKSYQLILL